MPVVRPASEQPVVEICRRSGDGGYVCRRANLVEAGGRRCVSWPFASATIARGDVEGVEKCAGASPTGLPVTLRDLNIDERTIDESDRTWAVPLRSRTQSAAPPS